MAKPLLTDALWKRIEPLLPPHKPRRRRFPGRKPIDDRKALTGILFVLKTGRLSCCSGSTPERHSRCPVLAGTEPVTDRELICEFVLVRYQDHPLQRLRPLEPIQLLGHCP